MDLLVFRPEAWHWIVLGFALMAVEIVVPTTLFLWFGIAGVATGALLLVVDLSTAYQIGVFGFLALLSYVPIRLYVRRKDKTVEDAAQGLNQRGSALVGRRVTVMEAVRNGFGAAQVGDSRWRISCEEDVEEGVSVEVVAVDGTTLMVRPADLPSSTQQ